MRFDHLCVSQNCNDFVCSESGEASLENTDFFRLPTVEIVRQSPWKDSMSRAFYGKWSQVRRMRVKTMVRVSTRSVWIWILDRRASRVSKWVPPQRVHSRNRKIKIRVGVTLEGATRATHPERPRGSISFVHKQRTNRNKRPLGKRQQQPSVSILHHVRSTLSLHRQWKGTWLKAPIFHLVSILFLCLYLSWTTRYV